MTAPDPFHVAFLGAFAALFSRWEPRIDAAGDDRAALAEIFHGFAMELGVELGTTTGLDVAGWPRTGPAAAVVDQHVERHAGILSAGLIETAAGLPLGTAAWRVEVAAAAVAAFRARVAELRQAAGGRA